MAARSAGTIDCSKGSPVRCLSSGHVVPQHHKPPLIAELSRERRSLAAGDRSMERDVDEFPKLWRFCRNSTLNRADERLLRAHEQFFHRRFGPWCGEIYHRSQIL